VIFGVTFDVFPYTRQLFLSKEPFRNKMVVFRNLYYSSRTHFYRAFVIYREELEKNCFNLIVNTWLILKSRGKLMIPSGDTHETLVEYRYCQTWAFVGNFILDDLIMMFKFYQIWDSKSWFLPFEHNALLGF
jgi:hypothetical protein